MKAIAGLIGILFSLLLLTVSLGPTSAQTSLQRVAFIPDIAKAYAQIQPHANFSTPPVATWTVVHPVAYLLPGSQAQTLRVFVDLLSQGTEPSVDYIVTYSDAQLPTIINIYASKSTTYPLIPDRIVYSEQVVLSNSADDCFCSSAAGVVDIPLSSFMLSSDDSNQGIVTVTIDMPDGSTLSATANSAWLAPWPP